MKTIKNLKNKIFFPKTLHQQQQQEYSKSVSDELENELYKPIVESKISNLDWNQAIHIEKCDQKLNCLVVTFVEEVMVQKQIGSSGGSSGSSSGKSSPPPVYQMVKQQQYYKVLLKTSPSSQQIAQTVYVNVLESILKLPIPEMRLLEYSNPEYEAMSNQILKLSSNNNTLFNYIKKELKKLYLLVMAYRPGAKTLEQLNFKEYFSSSNNGDKKYMQLGQLIAFDMFCNNWDRFPLIWESQGNFSNILFYDQPEAGQEWYFSLMDSNITYINNSSFTVGHHRYINRIKSLFFSLYSNPNIETRQVRRLREHMSKHYKVNIPESSGILLQYGIIQGIQRIVNNLTSNILKETKEKVKSMVKYENENIWKKGIDGIYLPFLYDIFDKYDEFELSQINKKYLNI
ncbi:protein kinase [Tieghemostelium lacteum]|uniref:Protein kinase n=1 Tax=Tieghemostelium lacteum TaxID=361077 RepID=A0A152A673_TIELA|nr:protein kinase [Tieghemostelium lacteum]|eukprot:KYR01723.1 protein kinase [Tieghemostelium lacteum]